MSATEKKILVFFLGVLFAGIHITGLAGAMGVTLREGKNDFAAFYMGAKLAGTGHLYDAARHYEGQKAELGYYMPAVTYIRLPYHAVLLKPLAWLDYRTAWKLFLLANALCAAWVYWKFLWGDTLAFLLGAAFLPTYAALANGQDVWFAAALCGLALLLARKGKEFGAGAALALCSIKPHLFVFVPAVLLMYRKWRILAGGAAGAAVLFAVSTAAEGGGWIGSFTAAITDPRVHPRLELMPTLRGLASTTGAPPWALWLLTALVIAAVLFISRRCGTMEGAMAAALTGGLLTNYHAYLADTVMLLLAFALLRRHGLAGLPLWLWSLLLSPVPAFLFVYGQPLSIALPSAMLCALAGLLLWRPSRGEGSVPGLAGTAAEPAEPAR